jgi:hypothetical protein
MSSNNTSQQCDTAREALIEKFTAYKAINKFRIFMNSLNKEVQKHVFDDMNTFFKEGLVSIFTTTTEKEQLTSIINHWQWSNFENDSTTWWQALLENHLHCVSLLAVINMLVD